MLLIPAAPVPSLAVHTNAVAVAEPAAGVRYLVGDLRVTRVRLRPAPDPASPALAFVQVENRGKAADVLVEVSVDGVARATLVPGPEAIGPKSEIDMTPEGQHLALDGAAAPFKAGDHVRGVLRFERAGPVPVDFTVEDAGEPPPP